MKSVSGCNKSFARVPLGVIVATSIAATSLPFVDAALEDKETIVAEACTEATQASTEQVPLPVDAVQGPALQVVPVEANAESVVPEANAEAVVPGNAEEAPVLSLPLSDRKELQKALMDSYKEAMPALQYYNMARGAMKMLDFNEIIAIMSGETSSVVDADAKLRCLDFWRQRLSAWVPADTEVGAFYVISVASDLAAADIRKMLVEKLAQAKSLKTSITDDEIVALVGGAATQEGSTPESIMQAIAAKLKDDPQFAARAHIEALKNALRTLSSFKAQLTHSFADKLFDTDEEDRLKILNALNIREDVVPHMPRLIKYYFQTHFDEIAGFVRQKQFHQKMSQKTEH